MVLSALLDGLLKCFVVIRAVQNYLRAVSASGRNFRQRRGQWHINESPDALASRMIGHTLRVVSGRSSDHSLSALFGGQRAQLIQRAALLESSRSLLIVKLEEDRVIGERGECFRVPE